MSFGIRFFQITVVIFFSSTLIIFAQNINTSKFQYISPFPSSKLNSTGTNIIIRYGNAFDKSLINKSSIFFVSGSKSGRHSGKLILTEKGQTLIFRPEKIFSDGEIVTVRLDGNLETVSGEKIPELQFSFQTLKVDINKEIKSNPGKYSCLLNPDFNITDSQRGKDINTLQEKPKLQTYTIQEDSLPNDFPKITVSSINNPAPGNIFFTPYDNSNNVLSYLTITDNYGIPIFFRKMPYTTYDFTKQPTGVLTYYAVGPDQHYVMDSSYNVIDSLHMQNGYTTDVHDLTILKNGHALLMGYDDQNVAMDSVVTGGNPDAIVIGLVIQELDKDKNVVFQWRSWDHFKITDATSDIILTNQVIDYVHCNSIETDIDGNIIISSRNMDEVTKINRETGDIIWRMGGIYCRNNEFAFINDSTGFSHQHDVKRLSNGNLTIFDNGNLHDPQYSRAVEYEVDEVNKTATLVWEYRNNPSTYSRAMGSVQRLGNQNTIIGWGWTSIPPAINEVKSDGSPALYMSWSGEYMNYRAYKYPWETNLFITRPDSLSFGYVPINDSLIKSIIIKNISDYEIEINGLLNRDSSYHVNNSLPVSIAAKDSAVIKVKFKPETGVNHPDDLYLQWNKKEERIARIVKLSGTTDSIYTDIRNEQNKLKFSLDQSYPNPFNPSTSISFTIPKEGNVILKIYDIIGREIRTLINSNLKPGKYNIDFNADDLPSGVYLYNLRVNNYNETKKMLLLK
ncbi:MAG: aryl-sulfate sulfotransferase [Ignavibacteriaceae bacterium]